MAEIYFYHLTQTSVEAALPQLLEKLLEREMKAIIISQNLEHLSKLDAHLWSYRADSFLPHGLLDENPVSIHPILLSNTMTAINNPDMCFLLDKADFPENINNFKRICIMFSGLVQEELDYARLLWRDLKNKSIEAIYFKQSETGGWQKN